MAKDKKGSALVKPEEAKQLAVSRYDESDLGAGLEGITSEELLIPFLVILQKGSPQVDEAVPGYIEGAKAGMIFNTVTQELYAGDEGISFLPVHREHKFVEWTPRTEGGGFKGLHDPEEPMVVAARKDQQFGKLETDEGNDLIETFYMYGIAVDDDAQANPAMIAFTSTQIRAYKRWTTTMMSIQLRAEDGRRVKPPMFAHMFRLRSKSQSNAKGTWYGWDIRYAEQKKEGATAAERSRIEPEDEFYIGAKEVRDLIVTNKVRVAYETAPADSEGDAEGAEASPGKPGAF